MSRAGAEKHPDTLVNKRGGRYKALRIVENIDRVMPPTPEGLHPKAEQAWMTLWASNLAGAFKETDLAGIERWAWYKSEWHKATEIPSNRRYVISLEKALRELEKSYGLDPQSRLRLGLTLIDEAKAVQGLKKPSAPKEMSG